MSRTRNSTARMAACIRFVLANPSWVQVLMLWSWAIPLALIVTWVAAGVESTKAVLVTWLLVGTASAWLLSRARRPRTLEPARRFLDRQAGRPSRNLCLILRPFGTDGMVGLMGVHWWSRIGIPGLSFVRLPTTLEKEIQRAATKQVGAETIALVDQGRRLVPAAPQFLSASLGEWEAVIGALLMRARLVVIIVPQDSEPGTSMVTELGLIHDVGMEDHCLVVFHEPLARGSAAASFASLIGRYLPSLRSMPPGTLVARASSTGRAHCWTTSKSGCPTTVAPYRWALAEATRPLEASARNRS